jgi:hypothetical protein
MIYGVSEIGDLSNNKYAAAMKERANGLAGWSGLLLLTFLIYQIVASESASLFSVRSFLVVLIGEIVFVIAAHFGNIILATITLPLVMPFGMKGKIAIAQNIQTTILVIFGLSLCVFAWFFASYCVSYAYPAPSLVDSSKPKIKANEPYAVHCSKPLPVFTLGNDSNPTKKQEDALCECIWKNLGQWEREVAEKISQGRGSEVSKLQMSSFPYRFGSAIKKCGGMDL